MPLSRKQAVLIFSHTSGCMTFSGRVTLHVILPRGNRVGRYSPCHCGICEISITEAKRSVRIERILFWVGFWSTLREG